MCMLGTEAPHKAFTRPSTTENLDSTFWFHSFLPFFFSFFFPRIRVCLPFFSISLSPMFCFSTFSLNCALTMGVQNARNRPKQDSGNNSPEPEGNERRSHRKSPSSASNCSSSSSSVVHDKVSCPIPCILFFSSFCKLNQLVKTKLSLPCPTLPNSPQH